MTRRKYKRKIRLRVLTDIERTIKINLIGNMDDLHTKDVKPSKGLKAAFRSPFIVTSLGVRSGDSQSWSHPHHDEVGGVN